MQSTNETQLSSDPALNSKGSRLMNKDLAILEGHKIRRIYDEKTETWWFSVVDIIQVLTEQTDYKAAQNY
jgi:hypothetical protein